MLDLITNFSDTQIQFKFNLFFLKKYLSDLSNIDKILKAINVDFDYKSLKNTQLDFWTFNNPAEFDNHRKLYPTFISFDIPENRSGHQTLTMYTQKTDNFLSQLIAYAETDEINRYESKGDLPIYYEFTIDKSSDLVIDPESFNVTLEFEEVIITLPIKLDSDLNIIKDFGLKLNINIQTIEKNALFILYFYQDNDPNKIFEIDDVPGGLSSFDLSKVFNIGDKFVLHQVDIKLNDERKSVKFTETSFTLTYETNVNIIINQYHFGSITMKDLRVKNIKINPIIKKFYFDEMREF